MISGVFHIDGDDFPKNKPVNNTVNKPEINCVVSRYNRDVNWVYNLKRVSNFYIYDKENPKNIYNVPVNKGNEASVYLKYIVDHYDSLADFTFFVHDEEYAWHHSGSIIDKLDEAVLSGKLYYNINDKCTLGSILTNEWYGIILDWYDIYIEPYIPLESLPDQDWTVGYRGSAQFLVHKSIITNLPLRFYADLYNWITTTDLINHVSGRILEWTWHIFWVIYPKLLNE
jgi:hypothetical protein